MRGDFSRIRFNRQRSYTAVLEQQGRVAVDADANEQSFIDGYESATQLVDVVGPYGGPASDAGFDISIDPDSNDIGIGPGRYYVQGLLCESLSMVSYEAQPYLVGLAQQEQSSALISGLLAAQGAQVLQLTLQAWQRLVTALDDPSLLEPAIGQADTTARLQTVWRVVANPAPAPAPAAGTEAGMSPCCQQMYASPVPPASTGTMTAGTVGPAADCGCAPVAAAGYQGIENQLYRIEIHQDGDETAATFKWSRENGSVVTAVTAVTGMTVTVSSLGPDANLGFQVGQWVELTDDSYQFGPTPNMPGLLYQIQGIQGLAVTLTGPAIILDPAQNARMRRWDQSGPAATDDGIALSAGSWIQLENGLQVSFTDGSYQSGDYWTIPARASTGQIEWPSSASGGNAPQSPTSLVLYSAPLACVHWTPAQGSGSTGGVLVDDCRKMFSPLTTIAPPTAIEALHVTGVSWVNDDVVTLDAFITSGLTITLDQAPTCPLSGANVIVTVELANPAAVDGLNLFSTPGNPRAPQPPVTNLRTVTAIDTPVTLDGAAITWQVPAGGTEGQSILIQSLNGYLYQGAPAQQWAKVRIRLLGQMIYAVGGAGSAYLDGRALGQPGVRRDAVTPRIDLQLPSGAGVVASDFEGWLYVAPMLQTNAVLVTPGAVTVTVDFLDRVTGVEPADPVAEIVLNYPPLTDATVTLNLSNTDGTTNGVGTIVSLPSTVTISSGQPSITVPVNVIGNPGVDATGTPITLSFNVAATVGMMLGGEMLANGSISVTGVAPPRLEEPIRTVA